MGILESIFAMEIVIQKYMNTLNCIPDTFTIEG